MEKTILKAIEDEIKSYKLLLLAQSRLKKAHKITKFRRWTFSKDNDVKISLVIEPGRKANLPQHLVAQLLYQHLALLQLHQ